MRQERPRWSGALDCPPEQALCGLLRLAGPTREDHLEGDARWAPDDGNCEGARRRSGSHAGSALLAQVGDRVGLTRALGIVVGSAGLRAGAAMTAGGSSAISR
jgi:hypothetical protein